MLHPVLLIVNRKNTFVFNKLAEVLGTRRPSGTLSEIDNLLADPLVCLCLDHLTTGQRRALEQDLDLALRIQTTLLPSRSVATAGWSACYHYEPAGPVSGDYCDLVVSNNGEAGLFFLTGDVAGKGVAASLLMSHLHAIFRSLLSVGMPVTQLMERANRVFCESTMPSHYATLVCGRAAGSGEIELCNAGHCPPVLVRGGTTTTIGTAGLPLGLFCNGQYAAGRIRLSPGDSLVLYTDGLTEARDRFGEEYGLGRLSTAVGKLHSLPAQALTRAVLEDLAAFLSGSPKTDDLTLLVIQRTGAPAQSPPRRSGDPG